MTATQQSVQVYGRKKTATAVAHCRSGQGLIKVNGKPLDQIEPKPLQYKLQEPLLVVGKGEFIFFAILKEVFNEDLLRRIFYSNRSIEN